MDDVERSLPVTADGPPPTTATDGRTHVAWLRERVRGATLYLGPPSAAAALDRDAETHDPLEAGPRLPGADAHADVVLVDRVLERVTDPDALLAEVARVVRPDGEVAVVCHLGPNPDPRHRRTLYPLSLTGLLSGHLSVDSVDVDAAVILVLARPVGDGTDDRTDDGSDNTPDDGSDDRTDNKPDNRPGDRPDIGADDGAGDGADGGAGLVAAIAATERAAHELALDAEAAHRDAAHHLGRIEELCRDLDERTRTLERTRETLAEARAQLRRTERSLEREQRQRTAAEDDRAELREQLRSERERRRNLLRSRWWRLGALISRARRDPRRLLRLPIDVVRLVRDR